MNNYEINSETLAIIPIGAKTTKIIETDNEYVINKNAYKIMDDSCKYFGSSIIGRVEGAKEIIGSNYKVPIIVDESRDIIFLPTESPLNENCYWISLKNLNSYIKFNKKTTVVFKNGKTLDIDISKGSFENQMYRATKLDYVIKSRKKG